MTGMTIEQLLPYLLPPLLGAVIGYVTNYIAIRMLFRPLRAWRLLGFRVPLTPGIIPGKRDELARKMGDMVGDHLLTADDVGRAFAKDSIQQELRLAVTDKLGRFHGQLDQGQIQEVEVEYAGEIAELNVAPITIAV